MPPSHEEVSEFVGAPRFNWNPGFNEEKGENPTGFGAPQEGPRDRFGILWNSASLRLLFPQNSPFLEAERGRILGCV